MHLFDIVEAMSKALHTTLNIYLEKNILNKMSLHLTSCLFATIVVHAYYLQNHIYHHTFLCLTVSSILFHTTHGETIRIIDKLLAHFSFIIILMDTPKALAANAAWLLLFPIAATCLWYGQSLLPERKHKLHFCLHLIAIVGVNVYLCVLYPSSIFYHIPLNVYNNISGKV